MLQPVQQNRSAVGNDQNRRAVEKKSVPSSKEHIGGQPADLVNFEGCAFCTKLKIVANSPASLQPAQINSIASAAAYNVMQMLTDVSAAPQSDQQKWCPYLYSIVQSIEYRRHCPMRLSAQVTRKPNSFAIENKNAVTHNKSVRAIAAHLVIVASNHLTWRYADDLGKEVLNVEIREGKKYINVQDDWYELQLAKKGQYEIFIPTDTAIKNYVPVYMEPLSRTWHMSVLNGHPVFKDKHQRLLTRISQEADPNTFFVVKINNNPRVYGPGKIYHAVKSSQASAHSGQNFVEMNGKLVPVRHPHGDEGLSQYEAFDSKRPHKKGRALAWDGDRWIFEQANSVQASHGLRKKTKSATFVKEIDINTLTAPDRMGLRRSADGKAYLKVNKNFIQLRHMNDNRYAIRLTPHSHNMISRFRGDKFFPESIAARLKNLLTVGLNGRKRPHPVDVLKRQDGFDIKSAKELLSEYEFPENGLFDAYTFVLDIEQNGRIPLWAEKFKKRARLDMTPPDDSILVKLHKPGEPDKEKHFYLGEELGEGKFATVYADATNKYFVIKRYDAQEIKNMPAIVNSEVENFTRYYGKNTAKIFIDSEGIYHVRMYRVSGETLDSLPPNSLPENAVEKYVDMLEELNAHGIFHDDLHTDNLIWDKNTERFYPIDIKNNKEVFFNSSPKDKDILNSHTSENWEYTLRLIREKQIKAAV
uniref:Ribosomal protein S6 kinase alpha-5 n=1 Tax=Erwinia amylovora ATCC BAA-2158 TaxID=889211 RepID=E5B6L9_ERWAM|nr:Ribosomal protein S6 kinase alpha-5 [Erwinia amylovora ATCC BAA-2158]